MSSVHLLALASFFAPQAYDDGSQAAFTLSAVPACTWRQRKVAAADGDSRRLDLRARGRQGAVLVEAELERESDQREVSALRVRTGLFSEEERGGDAGPRRRRG